MRRAWIVLEIFLAVSAGAAPAPRGAEAPCASTAGTGPNDAQWEVGLALQFLNPTYLPDFATPVPAYGPMLSYMVFGNPLKIQALYGADATLSLQLVELGYQLRLRSPYLGASVEVGTHLLRYSNSGKRHVITGIYGGAGLMFEMASNFSLDLTMKGYHQTQPILSFGGGFRVSL